MEQLAAKCKAAHKKNVLVKISIKLAIVKQLLLFGGIEIVFCNMGLSIFNGGIKHTEVSGRYRILGVILRVY